MQRLRSLVHKEIGFLCRGQDRVSQRQGAKRVIARKPCFSREARLVPQERQKVWIRKQNTLTSVCVGDWTGQERG